MGAKNAPVTGAMFWAYGKAGNGNEMETVNGNWKLKTEMETQPHWKQAKP